VLCIVPMFFRFSPVGLCVVILLWVVGVVGWFNGIIRVSKLYVEESLVFGFVVWVCFCVFSRLYSAWVLCAGFSLFSPIFFFVVSI
jgi:hypothetical protein